MADVHNDVIWFSLSSPYQSHSAVWPDNLHITNPSEHANIVSVWLFIVEPWDHWQYSMCSLHVYRRITLYKVQMLLCCNNSSWRIWLPYWHLYNSLTRVYTLCLPSPSTTNICWFPSFHYFHCLNLEDGRGLSAGSYQQRQKLLFSAVSYWFCLMNTHVGPAQDSAWGEMHTEIHREKQSERWERICPFMHNQTNSTAETHWAFISM